MWEAANRELARFNGANVLLLNPRHWTIGIGCEDYAYTVRKGTGNADVKCQCWEVSICDSGSIPGTYQPGHVAVALKSCAMKSWDEGIIWDAWPNGILKEFPMNNWRPAYWKYHCTLAK
jgi:hypothetical protein